MAPYGTYDGCEEGWLDHCVGAPCGTGCGWRLVIIAPRLVVLPERLTFEPRALSAALAGPRGRLLVEEPQLVLLDGLVVVDFEPQPEELLLPQLLPEELRDDPQLEPELREELNEEERPPLENPPPPPRAKPLSTGKISARARSNAVKTR